MFATLNSYLLRRTLAALLFISALLIAAPERSRAASITVDALGTSDTYGKGVGRNEAYPARLQAKLKERGIDARVINAGVNGDPSNLILKRVNSAVPNGTKLVLLEISPVNERKKRADGKTSENISAIKSQLSARGIKCIEVTNTIQSHFRGGSRLADGHLAPVAYESIATSLASEVASALGR